MRIGIMGGTYNPPHIGHLHAAEEAREYLQLEKLLLVPASIPPHKNLPPKTPNVLHRLAMTEIAAQNIGAEVCDIEIHRIGPSYTADTIDQLRVLYPNDELYLIIGTDMFLTIQEWYQPVRIFKEAQLAVIARETGDEVRILNHIAILSKEGARVHIIPAEPLPISSTQLRENLHAEDMIKFMPQGVYKYINEHGLYK